MTPLQEEEEEEMEEEGERATLSLQATGGWAGSVHLTEKLCSFYLETQTVLNKEIENERKAAALGIPRKRVLGIKAPGPAVRVRRAVEGRYRVVAARRPGPRAL